MKIWRKLLAAVFVIATVTTIFTVSVSAEEIETVTEEPLSLDDFTFTFTYTSDSAVKEGMSYQTYEDPISGQSGIELIPNFGIGYALYDDPDTEIIDGIRINGAETVSLRIPVTSDTSVLEYTVAVRTVYTQGASGDLAQILDGVYDYSKLITNPIVIFQLLYWVFMAIAGFTGLITAARSKRQKVKTADEIAEKVSEKATAIQEYLLTAVTDMVKSEILPLAQASVRSGKEAVKAIVLSTSKSKEAPSALLDVFKTSEDIDVADIVDKAYETLSKAVSEHEAKHAANISALHNIANHVIQEDVSDATNTKSEQVSETPKTKKSVF